MPQRKSRLPSLDEIQEKVRRGIIDDSLVAPGALDLEDWEILREPPPDEQAAEESRASV
jgi:hypothetical protein